MDDKEPTEEEKAFLRRIEAQLEMSEKTIAWFESEGVRIAALAKKFPARREKLRAQLLNLSNRLTFEQKLLEKLL